MNSHHIMPGMHANAFAFLMTPSAMIAMWAVMVCCMFFQFVRPVRIVRAVQYVNRIIRNACALQVSRLTGKDN